MPADPGPSPVSSVAVVGGTGALGFGLALRLAQAGVHVVIGSRDEGRAADAAARIRASLPSARADARVNRDAVTDVPVVFLCVPFAAQAPYLAELADAFVAGQVLVDATVPLATAVGGRPTSLLGLPHGSAAEQARALVPDGVEVVSALHTVSGAKLAELGTPLDEDVLVAGNSGEAKRAVAQLISAIPGLRPVDCGRLQVARMIESLTPLLISVNRRNKVHAGIRLADLAAPRW
jgi:NADPH-dependent F420 reductase